MNSAEFRILRARTGLDPSELAYSFDVQRRIIARLESPEEERPVFPDAEQRMRELDAAVMLAYRSSLALADGGTGIATLYVPREKGLSVRLRVAGIAMAGATLAARGDFVTYEWEE